LSSLNQCIIPQDCLCNTLWRYDGCPYPRLDYYGNQHIGIRWQKDQELQRERKGCGKRRVVIATVHTVDESKWHCCSSVLFMLSMFVFHTKLVILAHDVKHMVFIIVEPFFYQWSCIFIDFSVSL
jgi:hypothetical protein